MRCQNFLKGFSPSPFRWVLPAGLAMGPRLPRQNTTDSGSREGPRWGRPAAHRGQGGGGCEGERRGPWPRTRIWGKPPEAMGSLREEVDEMLIRFMVQVFI